MTSNQPVRIRMYNVGFGDCFLITIGGATPHALLIDAGFHSQGKGAFSANDLAQQVLDDVAHHMGELRVDVVVATHRHQDHVFAFNSQSWELLDVGEVWMPWVEDPDDAVARKLWRKHSAFAQALTTALPSFNLKRDEADEIRFMLWNAGINGLGASDHDFAAWSNAGALETLRDGFHRRARQRPRYLPSTKILPETFASDHIAGLRVHVLGPSRAPETLTHLDPEAAGQSYRALALRRALLTNAANHVPFSRAWFADVSGPSPLTLEEERVVRDYARAADGVLAARALDDVINATSLVFVLELGGLRLLFTGDAEWATWKHILANPQSRDLVRGATFVKVGHHGSHNATPRTILETLLAAGTTAMISTQQGPGKYRNDIPLPELLSALGKHRIGYVRSDLPTGSLPRGFERDPQNRWVDLDLTT